jgi:hypothetical protein
MSGYSDPLPNFDPHLSSSLANAAEIEQEYLCWLQRQELELLRMEEDDPGWRERGKDKGKVVGWFKRQARNIERRLRG